MTSEESDWINWDKHPAPADVWGILIKYEDGFVEPLQYEYDLQKPKPSRKFRDGKKIVGWRFLERAGPIAAKMLHVRPGESP